ncbi:Zinc finger protein, partial [Plecturocebus cupreus]
MSGHLQMKKCNHGTQHNDTQNRMTSNGLGRLKRTSNSIGKTFIDHLPLARLLKKHGIAKERSLNFHSREDDTGLILSPRQESGDRIMLAAALASRAQTRSHHVVQAVLKLLSSCDLLTSASQSTGIIETGFHHVGQATLELLTSSDLSALVSQSAQSAEIT